MDKGGWPDEILAYLRILTEVIQELRELREEVNTWHTGFMVGKTAGIGIGAVGTAISVIGFIGAPLTGGLSLAVTGAGMVTGFVGAVTSTGSELADSYSDG